MQYQAGGGDAFAGFRDLAQLLLSLTVLADTSGVRLVFGPRQPRDRAVVEGWPNGLPVRLNDGRFLRFSTALFLETDDQRRPLLKVERSVYQYQMDEAGDRWLVRYDYLRYPADPHPGHAHPDPRNIPRIGGAA